MTTATPKLWYKTQLGPSNVLKMYKYVRKFKYLHQTQYSTGQYLQFVVSQFSITCKFDKTFYYCKPLFVPAKNYSSYQITKKENLNLLVEDRHSDTSHLLLSATPFLQLFHSDPERKVVQLDDDEDEDDGC